MLLADCIQDPSPNFGPRHGFKPSAWVMHIEGGTEPQTDSWFNLVVAEVSATFSVAKDATKRQHVDTDYAPWSNGIVDAINHGYAAKFIAETAAQDVALGLYPNPNPHCESCEHEGQPGEEPTGAMFDASVELCAGAFADPNRLGWVPCDREHVIDHSEIGSHPQCPSFSEAFMARYIAAVNVKLGRTPAPVAAVATPPATVPLAFTVLQNTDAIHAFMETVADKDKFIADQFGDFIGRISDEFPALTYAVLHNADAVNAFLEEIADESKFVADQAQEFIAHVDAGSYTPAGMDDFIVQLTKAGVSVSFLIRVTHRAA